LAFSLRFVNGEGKNGEGKKKGGKVVLSLVMGRTPVSDGVRSTIFIKEAGV